MFCKKCGNELPEGSAFCPKCGAAADGEGTPAQTNSKKILAVVGAAALTFIVFIVAIALLVEKGVSKKTIFDVYEKAWKNEKKLDDTQLVMTLRNYCDGKDIRLKGEECLSEDDDEFLGYPCRYIFSCDAGFMLGIMVYFEDSNDFRKGSKKIESYLEGLNDMRDSNVFSYMYYKAVDRNDRDMGEFALKEYYKEFYVIAAVAD